jgi:hypothetical protein
MKSRPKRPEQLEIIRQKSAVLKLVGDGFRSNTRLAILRCMPELHSNKATSIANGQTVLVAQKSLISGETARSIYRYTIFVKL